jgi:predicted ATPase
MGGSIELDRNGRFYLRPDGSQARIEMPLVAEGHRKLGMLAQLIAVGAIAVGDYLFWDEPEANLNPTLIGAVARCIVELGRSGVQTFVATHSLFLLRELELLCRTSGSSSRDFRFFGLHRSESGVSVKQASSLDEIGDIASLDAELVQSDRYLELVP